MTSRKVTEKPTADNNKRVLVVGLGIAGMATAVRLKRSGWEPLIVERSPSRRAGGYFIGLFAEGREAAKRLGILGDITRENPVGSRTWELATNGDRSRSVGFLDQPGSPQGVLRGDIEAALWAKVEGRIEVRYGTTPEAITTLPNGVRVRLRDMYSKETVDEDFSLVVGADGLRSTVRELAFGPHHRYLKPFNAIVCAFGLRNQVPRFSDRDGMVLAEPGRSVWVFPFGDRPPTALLTYRTKNEDAEFLRPPRETISARYRDLDGDGVVDHLMSELEDAPDLLFDSVHQVRMPSWRSGHVALLGDSAWCLTLYSGMGATAGLLGADALGDALDQHPDSVGDALAEWESTLRPFIKKHQLAAYIKGQIFVPSNDMLARVRRSILRREGRKQSEQLRGEERIVA